jgi:hypothetical protein
MTWAENPVAMNDVGQACMARKTIVAAGRHFQSAEQLARFANAFELFSRVSGCCGVLLGITKDVAGRWRDLA